MTVQVTSQTAAVKLRWEDSSTNRANRDAKSRCQPRSAQTALSVGIEQLLELVTSAFDRIFGGFDRALPGLFQSTQHTVVE